MDTKSRLASPGMKIKAVSFLVDNWLFVSTDRTSPITVSAFVELSVRTAALPSRPKRTAGNALRWQKEV